MSMILNNIQLGAFSLKHAIQGVLLSIDSVPLELTMFTTTMRLYIMDSSKAQKYIKNICN